VKVLQVVLDLFCCCFGLPFVEITNNRCSRSSAWNKTVGLVDTEVEVVHFAAAVVVVVAAAAAVVVVAAAAVVVAVEVWAGLDSRLHRQDEKNEGHFVVAPISLPDLSR
jgi:hypothetical protein